MAKVSYLFLVIARTSFDRGLMFDQAREGVLSSLLKPLSVWFYQVSTSDVTRLDFLVAAGATAKSASATVKPAPVTLLCGPSDDVLAPGVVTFLMTDGFTR